jgi:hypothetical protein
MLLVVLCTSTIFYCFAEQEPYLYFIQCQDSNIRAQAPCWKRFLLSHGYAISNRLSDTIPPEYQDTFKVIKSVTYFHGVLCAEINNIKHGDNEIIVIKNDCINYICDDLGSHGDLFHGPDWDFYPEYIFSCFHGPNIALAGDELYMVVTITHLNNNELKLVLSIYGGRPASRISTYYLRSIDHHNSNLERMEK